MRRAAAVLLAALGIATLAAGVASALRAPDDPEGASVQIASASVTPGGTVAFTGSGFIATGGGGQVVTVKLDDTSVAGTFTADAGGTISGTVTAPTSTGTHWLRFLAGSGGPSGQGGGAQPPARSLSADFTVTAASSPPATTTNPAPTPTTPSVTTPTPTPSGPKPSVAIRSRALTAHGTRLDLRLRCAAGAACRGTATVRSARKVVLGGHRRVVTIARGAYGLKAGADKALSLALTRDGRRLLAAHERVGVRAAVTLRGSKSLSKTLTLTHG